MDLVHRLFGDDVPGGRGAIGAISLGAYMDERFPPSYDSKDQYTDLKGSSLRFDTFRPLYYGWYDYGFELYRLLVNPLVALYVFFVEGLFEILDEPGDAFFRMVVSFPIAAYSFISAAINLITRPIVTLLFALYSFPVEPPVISNLDSAGVCESKDGWPPSMGQTY